MFNRLLFIPGMLICACHAPATPNDAGVDASFTTPDAGLVFAMEDGGAAIDANDIVPEPLGGGGGPISSPSCEDERELPSLTIRAEGSGCRDFYEGVLLDVVADEDSNGIVLELDLSRDGASDCRLHVEHCGRDIAAELQEHRGVEVIGGHAPGAPGFAFLFEGASHFFCEGSAGQTYAPIFFAAGSTDIDLLPPTTLGIAADADYDAPSCRRDVGECRQTNFPARAEILTRDCERVVMQATPGETRTLHHDGRITSFRSLTSTAQTSCPIPDDPEAMRLEDHDGSFVAFSRSS